MYVTRCEPLETFANRNSGELPIAEQSFEGARQSRETVSPLVSDRIERQGLTKLKDAV